jgi:Ca2+/Na+ antiporter
MTGSTIAGGLIGTAVFFLLLVIGLWALVRVFRYFSDDEYGK